MEDAISPISGNVLLNDFDIDNGTVLNVAEPGELQGSYGTLGLAADGSYSYRLNNESGVVQSLGREAVVSERFSYSATDGMESVSSILEITLAGSNDAPILVAPLADQQVRLNKDFSWQLPAGSFADPDQGDILDFTATLADGSALPAWLSFDAATQTFSGLAPRKREALEVVVTATDRVSGNGNTAGSLSASDAILVTISHGNQGVGNGEDTPPPGQNDNCNDGPGTAPGMPGRRGGSHQNYHPHRAGNGERQRFNHGDEARFRLSNNSKAGQEAQDDDPWRQPKSEPPYLNASHWDEKREPEMARGGASVDPAVIFGRWLSMDLAASKALAEKKTLSWLDERLGADTTALAKESAGLLGSTAIFGLDPFSLQVGHGQELQVFKGFGEGIRKVA
jgi:VCBS repeat-containing protein